MSNAMDVPASPRRLWFILALAITLLASFALGVAGDRLYLWGMQRTLDPRLIGEWIAMDTGGPEEEQILRFHPDGTVDYGSFTKADGTQMWHMTHEYRPVNRDTVEMYDPFNGWTTRKLVFAGDQLKLLYNGEVWRLKRKNLNTSSNAP